MNERVSPVDGQSYGVPHGYGANLLQYRTDIVDPAPTSWAAVFEADSPYAGKITSYDSPIYIADAALYLMSTKPELGITNPYALDETQLAAAVDLLKVQRGMVGEYWSDYLLQAQAFTSGDSVIGTSCRGEGARHQVIGMLPARQRFDAVEPNRDVLVLGGDIEAEFLRRIVEISDQREIGDGRPRAEHARGLGE
mgnify:CR=1 FL=1